jgi:hypothetical protein
VLKATVGLGEVLQQTPLAVTAEPPSTITVLLTEAPVKVIAETVEVEHVARVVVF